MTAEYDLNPPYSRVCDQEHVLDDELNAEPDLALNGIGRCTESGCHGFVFSHCEVCEAAVPGMIDGGRYGRTVRSGGLTLSAPKGRIDGDRKWRSDCPACKAPFPWAREPALIRYHTQHLKEKGQQISSPLPLSERSAAAHAKHIEQSTGTVDAPAATLDEVQAALEWMLGAARSRGKRADVLGVLSKIPAISERAAIATDVDRLKHIALELLREESDARGSEDGRLLVGLFKAGRSRKGTDEWLAHQEKIQPTAASKRRRELTLLGANWLLDAEPRPSLKGAGFDRVASAPQPPDPAKPPWWKRAEIMVPFLVGLAVTTYLGLAPRYDLPPFGDDQQATEPSENGSAEVDIGVEPRQGDRLQPFGVRVTGLTPASRYSVEILSSTGVAKTIEILTDVEGQPTEAIEFLWSAPMTIGEYQAVLTNEAGTELAISDPFLVTVELNFELSESQCDVLRACNTQTDAITARTAGFTPDGFVDVEILTPSGDDANQFASQGMLVYGYKDALTVRQDGTFAWRYWWDPGMELGEYSVTVTDRSTQAQQTSMFTFRQSGSSTTSTVTPAEPEGRIVGPQRLSSPVVYAADGASFTVVAQIRSAESANYWFGTGGDAEKSFFPTNSALESSLPVLGPSECSDSQSRCATVAAWIDPEARYLLSPVFIDSPPIVGTEECREVTVDLYFANDVADGKIRDFIRADDFSEGMDLPRGVTKLDSRKFRVCAPVGQ